MGKRFELKFEHCIEDNKTHDTFHCDDRITVCKILNEQDEKIKNQEKLIANDNQRFIDKYFKELYKLDEAYNKDLEERLKEIEKLKQENQQLKQSQNNKAIEELEKVRKFYNSNSDSDWNSLCELDEYINNQITELKGEENGGI